MNIIHNSVASFVKYYNCAEPPAMGTADTTANSLKF